MNNTILCLVDPNNEEHVHFLYRLLRSRPAAANISHTSMPSLTQHQVFVGTHPYSHWYIVQRDGVMAGSVYLTARDEIGIHIAVNYQRRGLAKWAITALMKAHPRPKFLANIAPENQASHALFTGLGARVIQWTYAITGQSLQDQPSSRP